jgi:hypothetical protein
MTPDRAGHLSFYKSSYPARLPVVERYKKANRRKGQMQGHRDSGVLKIPVKASS